MFVEACKYFKQKTLLLVEHIPRLRNTFFSFSTIDDVEMDFFKFDTF